MQKDDNKAPLYIFITGVFLVGVLVYFLVKDTGKSEPDYENTGKGLSASLNEVKEQPLDGKTDSDLAQEALEAKDTKINGKEETMITPSPTPAASADRKLSVEAKLALTSPKDIINADKKYTAVVKTSLGDIEISLDAKNRPNTVTNFVYLARLHFYDDVIFHRVISGFMIQSGDPTGTGRGGPAYKFSDELSSPNTNAKGTISMANAGPDTNGSQFFINLVDNNFLDTKHSVFGKVTKGMDVVEAIGKVKTGPNDKPETPVVIQSVDIQEE